jgi:hypothetical protein
LIEINKANDIYPNKACLVAVVIAASLWCVTLPSSCDLGFNLVDVSPPRLPDLSRLNNHFSLCDHKAFLYCYYLPHSRMT